MTLSLHHFFILTPPGAPEGARLSELGLVEGPPNDHPGQGTANRRFFFTNAMLELLYVRDAVEATNGPARDLRFPERASAPGASPFGLILESTPAAAAAPFPGWRYRPPYLGADRYFHVGQNSEILQEPLCVFMPFAPPPRVAGPLSPEPFTTVTETRIHVPVDRPSHALQAVGRIDGVTVLLQEPHRIDLVFQHGRLGRAKDFRPALPLVVRW